MTQTDLPESRAIVQARPAGERWFSHELLQLFKRYTRKEFIAKFGDQPPPMDLSSKFMKLWWDSSAKDLPEDDPYVYYYVGQENGKAVMLSMEITAGVACRVFMPGEFDYPAYTIAQTAAYMQDSSGKAVAYIQPDRLSNETQAEALLQVIMADVPGFTGDIIDTSMTSTYFNHVYEVSDADDPANNFVETRRMWTIRNTRTGSYINVGRMLKTMHKFGIGAPGHFADSDGRIIWVSEKHLEEKIDTLPELPVPCRLLNDDEILTRRSPFDKGTVEVLSVKTPSNSGNSDMSLKEHHALLVRIAQQFGIDE